MSLKVLKSNEKLSILATFCVKNVENLDFFLKLMTTEFGTKNGVTADEHYILINENAQFYGISYSTQRTET